MQAALKTAGLVRPLIALVAAAWAIGALSSVAFGALL